MDRHTILREIEHRRNELRELGVNRLFLVGSFANDMQNDDSDIDIIVEFHRGRGLFKDYSGLYNLLESTLRRKIDLMKSELIRKEIRESMKEGKVYEAEI
jgi:uncharacterized protein